MADNKVDLKNEGVHWDLGTSQSYGEYLQLDKLLDAQKPNSIEQDEMLFIIVHQVSELWMRLFLHELDHVFECVRRDNLDPSFKMLARISRLQEELLGAWSVLSTLTPFEYSSFRNTLGRSSGFQSLQYRLLEFKLGNKNRDVIAVHKRDPAGYEQLERALNAPSIYDEVLRLLSRRGYGIPEELIERDFSEPYTRIEGGDRRLARRVSQRGEGLGPLRDGRAAHRSRPEIPALALPSSEDRRARHRLQAGHRRHRRRVVSREGARAQVLPGALAGAHVDVRSRRCRPPGVKSITS